MKNDLSAFIKKIGNKDRGNAVNRRKTYLKSIKYSFGLIFRSGKLSILADIAFNLLSALTPLLSAFLLKCLLDILQNGVKEISSVFVYIAFYLLSLVAVFAFDSFKNTAEDTVRNKAGYLYDCELSEKLSALPLSVIDTSEGKDKIDDVRYIKFAAVNSAHHIIWIASSLYSFIIAFITLFSFNAVFALIFLLLTLPGVITNVFFSKKSDELRMKTAPDVRKFYYYRWMLTDAWPAKDVRMYDLTVPLKKRYDEEKDAYRKANAKLDWKRTSANMLAELIMRGGETVFTVFAVIKAIKGEITVGDVAMYIGFAVTATASFQKIVYVSVLGFARTVEYMGRLFDFLDIGLPSAVKKTRALDRFESLTFKDVCFKYPLADKYVLSGVSFSLERGEKLSVVGINGSGKTTIVKLMLGLYDIESGSILINGYPLSDYDINDVRKMFSVLFQDFAQYPLTLRDNIALSDLDRADDDYEITEALKQSGVYDELLPKLENGLDSFMTRDFDDKGTELSKGQWQKIALSRTYFKNASVVIFDEPSAALDAQAEDRIFKNFEKISDNKTCIMISHRISSARMSDKVIVLDGGRITEQGSHDELVALNGLYAKLYNLQKEKYVAKENDRYE